MHGLMITKMKATILQLEARASQAWETCQKAVERGMQLEAEVARLKEENQELRLQLVTALVPDGYEEEE